jgi:O-antigen/teichoic acid export membrane protein
VVRDSRHHGGHPPQQRVRDPQSDQSGAADYRRQLRPEAEPVKRDGHYVPPGDDYRARQAAGLDILIGIASHAQFAMAEGATTILPVLPRWPERLADERLRGRDGVVEGDSATGPGLLRSLRLLRARFRSDHLVRNSLYLMLSNALQAAIGFGFWILMARLFSAQNVGIASSLISSTSILAFFALVGLNTTVMRFLPTARNKNGLLTAAFVMVSGVAAVIATGYVLLTPIVAPRLDFVAHSVVMTAGFALLAAATAVNVLTDSVFITRRRAELCAITDGLVGGVSKVAIGVILAGGSAYGLYLASLGGPAMAAVVSIILIIAVLHWRPSLTHSMQTLKPLLKFSGANYAANSMNLLPNVVVPLIVLDRLGAKDAGYYFVAFQIAGILMTAAAVIEASFMAEGSQAGANWRVIRRRSIRLGIFIFVPGSIVTVLAAHWMLLAFGSAYSLQGTGSLEMLAAAVLPVAACSWSWTVLRLTGRLGALIVSTAVYGASICGGAWFLAPHGLTAVSSAWLYGSAVAAAVSGILAATAKAPARHRRTARPRTEPDLA